MSDLDDFLTPTLARQLEAEKALINGDPGPRLAMWSTQEPVTVFGAEKTVIGSDEARQAFRWLATRFSNLTDYRFELVAAGASGDLAYTLGYEHITVSMDGGPVAPADPARHPPLPPRGRRVEDHPPPRRRPSDRSTPFHRRIDRVSITGSEISCKVDHLRVNQHPRPGTHDRSCHPATADQATRGGGGLVAGSAWRA